MEDSKRMKIRYGFVALIGIGVLAVATLCADTNVAEVNVAEVNEQKINREEYIMELERVPIPVGTDSIGKPVTVQAGYVALRNLIDRALVLELAKKEQVLPTKKQLESELARLKAKKDFEANLLRLGYTEADYLDDLNVELSKFNLRTKGITVTPDSVKKYYDDNLTALTVPEAVKIQLIQCSTEDAAKAVMEAAKTVDFSQLARENSIHPSRDKDGVIEEWMTPSSWPDAVWPLIWTALPNSAVGPFTLDGAVEGEGENAKVTKLYLIVKVLERRQKDTPSFESIKDDLTRMLMLSKSKRNLDKDLAIMRLAAKIKINMPRFDKAWQEAAKAAKDAK